MWRAEATFAQSTMLIHERVEAIPARAETLANDMSRRAEQMSADFTQSAERITSGVTSRFDEVSRDLTQKMERILDLGEDLAERVVARVDTTTSVMEEAVARPLVTLASVRDGIQKGLDVWREYRSRAEGDGKPAAPTPEQEKEVRRMIEETPTIVPQAETVEG